MEITESAEWYVYRVKIICQLFIRHHMVAIALHKYADHVILYGVIVYIAHILNVWDAHLKII